MTVALRNNPLLACTLGTAITLSTLVTPMAKAQDNDPYIWLEEVEGEDALAWVEVRNKHSTQLLEGDERFNALQTSALRDYNAKDKIAYGQLLGGSVHNFWQDDENIRGIWRRASLKSYRSGEPRWITIMDLDQVAKDEGENWVLKGRKCLGPDFGNCLVELSRGGGDAVVTREYDAVMKRFVAGGFETPEAKQEVVWIDRNTVLIGTDYGAETMTTSGYANQVKIWKRGRPLSSARLVHEGNQEDVGSFPFASHRNDGTYIGVVQAPDFFTEVIHVLDIENEEMQKLNLPRDISFQGFFYNDVVFIARKAWTIGDKSVAAGSLVSVNIVDAVSGFPASSLNILYEPDETSAIESVKIGKDRVFISVLDNVAGKLLAAKPSNTGWDVSDLNMPTNGALSIISADEWSDAAFFNYESFIQPDTLYVTERDSAPMPVQSLPARFEAEGLMTEQKFATSKDGTQIPYFVVRKTNTDMNGTTPTMLYGYGGFEISLTPNYLTGFSKLWLENGGAYVVANIRGGGEFGPAWHQAALKENRQKAFGDFIAVAENLIDSGLTKPKNLGIRGGSNGGLLVGAVVTQRPDLFNAVICAVPLLDMMRYHTLLAGASWMGEYGDPDDAVERAYIRAYSPYQNMNADTAYPEMFIYTSTKDDRVHPGHARKMTARLMEFDNPVIYYENTEGGHSAAANLKQRAYTDALQAVYALRKLSN
ncbi:prolyl oligopeptidase family serine peptidase [Kordiimonas aquimaris]|uniref:prolyl oligopeptidase family serine peptidase n=1 Tax=Kordiimonas aquimaris TaxID=707591 RepID=UPI0021CF8946|nr:prolyl oligopeptidase family serine peptidase [Kordiimonas aquimaris]